MSRKKVKSPDGSIYDGDWLDNKRHGYGRWTHPDGASYAGQWVDDKQHGEGTMIFADGTVYTGLWKEGKRSGQGTLTNPDGLKISGNWEDDKLSAEQNKNCEEPADITGDEDDKIIPAEGEKNTLFRKASLDSVSSPDQLNDYIRVSTPSVWIVVSAMFILLIAVFYWGFTGSMPTTINAQGVFMDGHAVCFISPDEAENIRIGQAAGISARGGTEEDGIVVAIKEAPMSIAEIASELNNEYLVQKLVEREFAVKVTIETDGSGLVDNTLLSISIITDSVRPIDFLWN